MKKTHIIALFFVVIAIGAIVSTMYKSTTYASFSEARLHPGREFHIIGTLSRGQPVEEQVASGSLVLSFHMTDPAGEESRVIYFGNKPQDFEKSDQVVLIGKYVDEVFVASSLLLKCPSKYNEGDLQPVEFEMTEISSQKKQNY